MYNINMKRCSIYLILLVLTAGARLQGDVTNEVIINPTIRGQIFEGFGQGHMGQFTPGYYQKYTETALNAFLDKLYLLENNGLGLEICRVLMPVGDNPAHDHMSRIPYPGNKAFEPEENVFDWTGQEANLWYIDGAAERGATMWANWYSVPYWLTVSECSAGGFDGSANNLIAGKEARFVKHVCDVLVHFRDSWGINFEYLSLINEPEADWWVYGGGQPGCHVSASQAITIHQNALQSLGGYNLSPQLVAYDAAYLTSYSYLDTLLGSAIEPNLAVISCHQYQVSDYGINGWNQRAASYNKRMWSTEWGDWANDGYPYNRPVVQFLIYATKIHEGLSKLHANAWVMWEPDFIFDSGPVSLIPRKAYWAVAHYSRFIRPGMQRLSSSDTEPNSLSTVWIGPENPQGRKLTIVTVNNGAQDTIAKYDLSGLSDFEVLEKRRTSNSENYAIVPAGDINIGPDFLTVRVPHWSVVTISLLVTNCTKLYADFDNNCIVDFSDIEKLALGWLMSHNLPCPESLPDADGDCATNFKDLAKLADEYLNVEAFGPRPFDGAVNVSPGSDLVWGVNYYAHRQDVYLGGSENAVANAGRNSPEYKITADHNTGSYDAALEPETAYYWRIDTIDSQGNVRAGKVWSFTTGQDSDLIGWYKFDESSGNTAADSSIYGFDATVTGAAWTAGKIGNALNIAGTGSVNVPSAGAAMLNNQVTVMMWQYGGAAQPHSDTLFIAENSSASRVINAHVPWSDGIVYWDAGSSSSSSWDRISKAASAGNYKNGWNHWVFTKNATTGTMKIYLNGTLWHSGTGLTKGLLGATQFRIGSNIAGVSNYYGIIDSFRIYKRELNADEIFGIYQDEM